MEIIYFQAYSNIVCYIVESAMIIQYYYSDNSNISGGYKYYRYFYPKALILVIIHVLLGNRIPIEVVEYLSALHRQNHDGICSKLN